MLLREVCVLCARPGDVVCPRCAGDLAPAPSLALPLGIDACAALFDYAGARRLITSLKNGGRRDLVGWLAAEMAERIDVPRHPMVTWAPTSAPRRRARGYDQAELLARAFARRSGLRCADLLRREPGPAQSGRCAEERRENPRFTARRRSSSHVLLVDDVVTTGSTLTAAARALRAAGASTVVAAVAARSPGRRRLGS